MFRVERLRISVFGNLGVRGLDVWVGRSRNANFWIRDLEILGLELLDLEIYGLRFKIRRRGCMIGESKNWDLGFGGDRNRI